MQIIPFGTALEGRRRVSSDKAEDVGPYLGCDKVHSSQRARHGPRIPEGVKEVWIEDQIKKGEAQTISRRVFDGLMVTVPHGRPHHR